MKSEKIDRNLAIIKIVEQADALGWDVLGSENGLIIGNSEYTETVLKSLEIMERLKESGVNGAKAGKKLRKVLDKIKQERE